MQFEGHNGKEASTGSAMLPAKHGPMKITTAAPLPPGHPTFGKTPAGKSKSMPSTYA